MTIDANLIEGFKIGLAVGIVLGVIGTFILSLVTFYGLRKKYAERIAHPD